MPRQAPRHWVTWVCDATASYAFISLLRHAWWRAPEDALAQAPIHSHDLLTMAAVATAVALRLALAISAGLRATRQDSSLCETSAALPKGRCSPDQPVSQEGESVARCLRGCMALAAAILMVWYIEQRHTLATGEDLLLLLELSGQVLLYQTLTAGNDSTPHQQHPQEAACVGPATADTTTMPHGSHKCGDHLPTEAVTAASSLVRPFFSAVHGQCQVVVVDGDVAQHSVLRVLLGTAGYKLLCFKTESDVVDHMETCALLPDCLLLGCCTTDTDNLQTLRRIRQAMPLIYIPAVLVLPRDSAGTILQGLHMGADDVLRKPYLCSELLACLQGQLGQATPAHAHIEGASAQCHGQAPLVACVDADGFSQAVVASVVKTQGYRCLPCASASHLLDTLFCDDTPPDLVLLSCTLTDSTSCLETIRNTRSLHPKGFQVPIIVLANQNSRRALADCLQPGGADDYVTKPLRRGELLARMQMHVRSPSAGPRPDGGRPSDLLQATATAARWGSAAYGTPMQAPSGSFASDCEGGSLPLASGAAAPPAPGMVGATRSAAGQSGFVVQTEAKPAQAASGLVLPLLPRTTKANLPSELSALNMRLPPCAQAPHAVAGKCGNLSPTLPSSGTHVPPSFQPLTTAQDPVTAFHALGLWGSAHPSKATGSSGQHSLSLDRLLEALMSTSTASCSYPDHTCQPVSGYCKPVSGSCQPVSGSCQPVSGLTNSWAATVTCPDQICRPLNSCDGLWGAMASCRELTHQPISGSETHCSAEAICSKQECPSCATATPSVTCASDLVAANGPVAPVALPQLGGLAALRPPSLPSSTAPRNLSRDDSPGASTATPAPHLPPHPGSQGSLAPSALHPASWTPFRLSPVDSHEERALGPLRQGPPQPQPQPPKPGSTQPPLPLTERPAQALAHPSSAGKANLAGPVALHASMPVDRPALVDHVGHGTASTTAGVAQCGAVPQGGQAPVDQSGAWSGQRSKQSALTARPPASQEPPVARPSTDRALQMVRRLASRSWSWRSMSSSRSAAGRAAAASAAARGQDVDGDRESSGHGGNAPLGQGCCGEVEGSGTLAQLAQPSTQGRLARICSMGTPRRGASADNPGRSSCDAAGAKSASKGAAPWKGMRRLLIDLGLKLKRKGDVS